MLYLALLTHHSYEAVRLRREDANDNVAFFKLPPEIRNRIYDQSGYKSILGICRAIRQEVLPKFCAAHVLHLDIDDYAKAYVRSLPDHAIAACRRVNFHTLVSKRIFGRSRCRIHVVIDRCDNFFPFRIMWERDRTERERYLEAMNGYILEDSILWRRNFTECVVRFSKQCISTILAIQSRKKDCLS